jgi:hypothetical protein
MTWLTRLSRRYAGEIGQACGVAIVTCALAQPGDQLERGDVASPLAEEDVAMRDDRRRSPPLRTASTSAPAFERGDDAAELIEVARDREDASFRQ